MVFGVFFSIAQQPVLVNEKENNSNAIKWHDTTYVVYCSEFNITKPLIEIAAEHPIVEDNSNSPFTEMPDKHGKPVQTFQYSVEKDGAKYGNDSSILQLDFGKTDNSKALLQNWDAQQATGFRPFDPTGAAGPNHYVQMINSTTYQIRDKTGTILVTGTLGDLWSPATGNAGDPIVLYDKAADRWFMSQFDDGSANEIYIAISATADPTGSWYTYTFTSPDFPDYLKFSTWVDGYYMTANYAEKVFAFNRTKMLAGDPSAEAVYKTYTPPASGFFVPMTGDCSDAGDLPSVGTPCPIFSYQDDAWGYGPDAMNIYTMSVNWTTLSATISGPTTLSLNSFDASYDASWNDISQPGTTQKLDGIGGAMWFRSQYRIWSGYNTALCSWGVKISASQRGIFWCELRQDQGTGTWSVYQQSIYAPGTDSYWMGSLAMNDAGHIAMAYNKGSSATYMSIGYTGRLSCDPLNTMTIAETVAQAGAGSQTSMNRVGDYSQTTLDPDGMTFWFTGEYMKAGGSADTRIISFTLPGSCAPPDATGISPTSLYEDRGKQFTVTGTDLSGCTFTIGGVAGTVVSNDGSTAVVTFPAGNYTDGTLVVSNGTDTDSDQSITINRRNTIPVVSGAGVTSDNHPTIESAVDGLYAWYGTTAFNAGELTGTKTIEVSAGTYTEGVSLTAGLNPTAANPLIIQPATGATVIVDATGNNYGFDLSTVDYVQLKGFTVHSANLDNIYALGDNVTISYNKTYGSVGGSGIKAITGTPFTIQNNLSYNNYKYGIHINTNNNVVKNNTTYNNGGTYTPATGVEIFNEIFTDGAGWTTDGTWSFYTGTSGSPSGDPVAGIEAGTGYIYSPVIDVTGYNNLTITNYYRSYGTLEAADDIAGAYSFDNTNWTTFFTDADDQAAWITASVSGITPSSNSLYLRFFGDVDASEYWVIDDVTVTGDEAGSASNTGAGLYVETGTGSTVQNNIYVAKAGSNDYYTLISETGATVNSSYNTYYTTNTNLFDYNGTIGNTGPISTGDITTDPQFVNAGTDFHIKSTAGSYAGGTWPPLTATGGTWTLDASTSPAVDAGNTADAWSNEPAPNGSRINQGAYGNTLQASKTGCTMPTAPTSVSASPNPITLGNSTTLSYSGGSGTTFNWYSGSCGGTSVGTGQDLSVSPTATTTYYGRWENSCGNSSCQSVTVTVNGASGHTLSGKVSYDNGTHPAIANQTVNLYDASSNLVATATTDASGNYSFSNVVDGNYTVTPAIAAPFTWGGATSMDVTIYKQEIGGADNLSGVREISGCVSDGILPITAPEMTTILRRIVGLSYTFVGDWAYSDGSVTISGADATLNIQTVCYGDANASKSAAKDLIPLIVTNSSVISVSSGDYFEIPVTIQGSVNDLSSVTLEIPYDNELLDITDVDMANNNYDMLYNINGGVIRIAYSSLNAVSFNGDLLLTIKGNTKKEITSINLFENAQGEFGDINNNILTGISIELPLLALATTNTEKSGDDVKLYPNPVKDYLIITNVENSKIEIFNVLGSVIYSTYSDNNSTKIYTNDLSIGTYYVKIYKDNDFIIRKFIVLK